MAEQLRGFVPPETPTKRVAFVREAEAAETGAEGTLDFKRAEGTRVLEEAALLARAGDLMCLGEFVILHPMAQEKAAEVITSHPPQAPAINPVESVRAASVARLGVFTWKQIIMDSMTVSREVISKLGPHRPYTTSYCKQQAYNRVEIVRTQPGVRNITCRLPHAPVRSTSCKRLSST